MWTFVHRSTSGPLPTSTFDMRADDGQLIGFCQVRHKPSHNPDLPETAASHIYYEVDPAFRGRGFGKALFGLALNRAKYLGINPVRVSVLEADAVSRHIIEDWSCQLVLECVCRQGERYRIYEMRFRPL
jgi:predicted acetyltransferase